MEREERPAYMAYIYSRSCDYVKKVSIKISGT